jgi:uncharacterized protein (UPF0276 family)
VEKAKQYIKKPLILENITYAFQIPGNELTETQFISQVAENAEVGLLLDVTNLYINSVNHHFDFRQFLQEVPLERVVQFHFVGGYWLDGILIDGHAHATQAEIWQVLEEALHLSAVKGIILERDENFPPYDELVAELNQARSIWNKYRPNILLKNITN